MLSQIIYSLKVMWHPEVISHIKTIYLLITRGLSDTDDEVFLHKPKLLLVLFG